MVVLLILSCLIGPIIGYLSGSILYAVLLTKIFKNKDIRTFGSRNPGFTNTLRSFGIKFSILILILDMIKIIFPTIIIFLFINYCVVTRYNINFDKFNYCFLLYLTPIFGVIGHIFPIFFKFKGGKGVASYFGLLFTISPFIFLISCLILISIVLIKKIMSIGSIISVLTAPFLFLIPGINYFYLVNQNFISTISYTIHVSSFLWLLPIFFMLLFTSFLIIYKHKINIINIINKKEKKLSILG